VGGEIEELPLLAEVRPRVKRLFYKGDLNLLEHGPKLAVVGSRRMSSYGQVVVERWMSQLVEAGVVIVSGFMYGIDQVAHRECLTCGGETIAVLGWGIDANVSEEDEKLYADIEERGLIVSEYEGTTKASLWMFPLRNRIVAGLVDAVLVVEAGEKSGSLITARFAQKFGRKVLAVPGMVTSKVSQGTNDLIKSGLGVMVTSAAEVLGQLGKEVKQQSLFEAEKGNWLTELLASEPLSIDEMVRKTGKEVEELSREISRSELLGVIEEIGGKYILC